MRIDLSHLCFPHATQGCLCWRGLAGELFRVKRASTSQPLPALLSVRSVSRQFLFLWKVYSPKNVFPTVLCIHYFLQPLLCLPLSHAKLSPKVIFSLSFDYLLQKHRTPRHSLEHVQGPWDLFNLLLTKCFLRLLLLSSPGRLLSALSVTAHVLGSLADKTLSVNQGILMLFPAPSLTHSLPLNKLFPPFCYFLISKV